MYFELESNNPDPHEQARRVLQHADEVLAEARQAIGQPSDNDPSTAFPQPASIRADSPRMEALTDEQRAELAKAGRKLGFGRPESVGLSEQGFFGAVVEVEGGLLPKIRAEEQLVNRDIDARPSMYVFCGSPHRRVTDSERVSATDVFGFAPETEYEVTDAVARAMNGFVAHKKPVVLPFSYDINDNFAVSQNEPGRTGQLVEIGTIAGVPVVVLRVDRRELAGGKYELQPDCADIIQIIDRALRLRGDDISPIVTVTGHTYEPSRQLAVSRAKIFVGDRRLGLAPYGVYLMNEIKGTPGAPAPTDQLPGELRATSDQAEKLRKTLSSFNSGNQQEVTNASEADKARFARIRGVARWLMSVLRIRRL